MVVNVHITKTIKAIWSHCTVKNVRERDREKQDEQKYLKKIKEESELETSDL